MVKRQLIAAPNLQQLDISVVLDHRHAKACNVPVWQSTRKIVALCNATLLNSMLPCMAGVMAAVLSTAAVPVTLATSGTNYAKRVTCPYKSMLVSSHCKLLPNTTSLLLICHKSVPTHANCKIQRKIQA